MGKYELHVCQGYPQCLHGWWHTVTVIKLLRQWSSPKLATPQTLRVVTGSTNMAYDTACFVSLLFGVFVLWMLVRRCLANDKLGHLPGPRGLPIVGSIFDIEKNKLRISLHTWAQKYGGVYKVRLALGDVVVVSGYEPIHHVLVSNGQKFAGRTEGFRGRFLNFDHGIAGLQPNDASWIRIRKLSHRYMKQFGDGMSRLEAVLSKNAEYLLQEFDSNIGKPMDVMNVLKSAALRTTAVLLLGTALDNDDPLLDMLLRYERGLFEAIGTSLGSMILDVFPVLIHFPLPESLKLKKFKEFQDESWEKIKEAQSKAQEESLTQVLLQAVSEKITDPDCNQNAYISELDAAASVRSLVFAGTATTARVLYCLLNVLAFRQDIQKKVHEEIQKVLKPCQHDITVADRARMPYLRAVILECLRAYPPTPIGAIPHVSVTDASIPGYGFVPEGTVILINTWALHHDSSFWKDPEVIRPERFLDEDGQLLPPDHPNRKHVLPFGAGPRVCLGEVFARTRLFLWTSAVVSQFVITPAPDSDKGWLDPRVHFDNVVLKPLPNNIIFQRR